MAYRKLTDKEIKILENQGSRTENWETILVKNGFKPDCIRNVAFAGRVKLGCFSRSVEVEDGVIKPSGLYNAHIQDCTIGNDVYIADVKNLVRYDIGSEAIIENVGSLVVTGKTGFGNGIRITVLNEGGGRESIIFDELTSQIAYLQAVYRHDEAFINNLFSMIDRHVKNKESARGTIGNGAKIINCPTIKNVRIGEYAVVSGALKLEEGTIAGSRHDPVFVGEGVIVRSFIIQPGSRVDGGAMLDRCFVGQSVHLGKQFSAENSCFFANSEGFHGEACSVFAGPYTVTHHKSTLLIAGLFSFFNAGSGSNQSNHMYKLGPVHQGILERGCKTGSYSYLIWPCRVGAYTTVIGKHYANFDTSDLPFSVIVESGGNTVLIPAANLFAVGTRRDSAKWPTRDRRKDQKKYDLIHFDLFNPYTIGKILRGIELLKALDEGAHGNRVFVRCRGVHIRRSNLKIACDNYEMALSIFVGNEIMKKLEVLSGIKSFDEILKKIDLNRSETLDQWIDMSGMLAPKNLIDDFVDSVRLHKIAVFDDLIQRLTEIHRNYDDLARAWCVDLIERQIGLELKKMNKHHFVRIIKNWRDCSLKLNSKIRKDAAKEFSEKSQIGYGLDGDDEVKKRDFEAVRGRFVENTFVAALKEESKQIEKRADKWIAFLEKL